MTYVRSHALPLLYVALTAFVLIGCGGSGGQTKTSRCVAGSAGLVSAISSGLESGVSISNSQMVKSTSFDNVFFVSARLAGPGLSGSDVATWATNSPSGEGTIFSVGGVAHQFSQWGEKADISSSDDGYAESQACAKG